MADYRAETRKAAKRYGLDPGIFSRQINQESGFNPNARSGSGAIGIAQIMPATAKGWGVDPTDPIASLDAAARNMASYVKKFGGYENALRAYNAGEGAVQRSHGFPETNNYVRIILGGKDPGNLASPSSSAGTPASAAPGSSGSGQAAAPVLGDPGQAPDVTSLLASLLSRPPAAPQAQPVAAPSFTAHPNLPGGVQMVMPQTAAPEEQSGGVQDALSLLGSLQGADPAQTAPGGADAAGGAPEPVVTAVRNQRAAAKSMGLSGSKILELIYNNGGAGYGIKNGQDVNGSQFYGAVWQGHKNHVHVAAGPNTVVALGNLAQDMGLRVGENEYFTGQAPGAGVHADHSNHYRRGQTKDGKWADYAIDVSGDAKRMERFAKAVDVYNRTRRLPAIT